MIIYPPKPYFDNPFGWPSYFLAGSIEMGAAENWQEKVCKAINSKRIVIYNPRRKSWDSSWKQEITNPVFKQQVEWEMDMLTLADIRLFYFAPGTKSPITLLELGLIADFHKDTTLVCCPQGFWRKGNVDIVCERYQIEQVPTLDALINRAKNYIYG